MSFDGLKTNMPHKSQLTLGHTVMHGSLRLIRAWTTAWASVFDARSKRCYSSAAESLSHLVATMYNTTVRHRSGMRSIRNRKLTRSIT